MIPSCGSCPGHRCYLQCLSGQAYSQNYSSFLLKQGATPRAKGISSLQFEQSESAQACLKGDEQSNWGYATTPSSVTQASFSPRQLSNSSGRPAAGFQAPVSKTKLGLSFLHSHLRRMFLFRLESRLSQSISKSATSEVLRTRLVRRLSYKFGAVIATVHHLPWPDPLCRCSKLLLPFCSHHKAPRIANV